MASDALLNFYLSSPTSDDPLRQYARSVPLMEKEIAECRKQKLDCCDVSDKGGRGDEGKILILDRQRFTCLNEKIVSLRGG
jgi:hypothetical protein